jgi:hypothetical protein
MKFNLVAYEPDKNKAITAVYFITNIIIKYIIIKI